MSTAPLSRDLQISLMENAKERIERRVKNLRERPEIKERLLEKAPGQEMLEAAKAKAAKTRKIV